MKIILLMVATAAKILALEFGKNYLDLKPREN